MKFTQSKYLIFSFLVLLSFLSRGQETDSTSSETIIETENPYKKNRTKWLNDNGFNTGTYNWNDPEINLYINQAVKNRSTGNVLAFTGGGLIMLGLVGNLAGRLAHQVSNNDPNRQYQGFKGPYYLGGAIAASAIVLHLNAKSKLKKAKRAREKKFSN